MNLPEVIHIRPFTFPLNATVSVPGSKSLSNRALVLAALDSRQTVLRGALWSEDTEIMCEALRRLGFWLETTQDSTNTCNRTILIHGRGGVLPRESADLFVGTAGTAARFLTALCALGKGPYRLQGTLRMHERPMKEVFDALRALGAKVEDANGHLPATIAGPIRSGHVKVSDVESSQFASALILLSRVAGLTVECTSSPYVEMTRQLLAEWKMSDGTHDIEPDASSASYFIALEHLHGGRLILERWPAVSTQVDHRLSSFLPSPKRVSRKTDLGDAILTLAIVAAAQRKKLELVEAANLRKQECDRLAALRTELEKCGVPAFETPDSLVLEPAEEFRAAVIETYKDHRIAMSFALLGTMDLRGDGAPWIALRDPGCVAKTFPNFFETLEETVRRSCKAGGIPFLPVVLKPDGTPIYSGATGREG